MSRYVLFGLFVLTGLSDVAAAQDRIVTTRVYTEPAGARFYVDGTPYRSAQAFNWPVGSKHTISVETYNGVFPGTRSVFSSWSDSTGAMQASGDTVVVTADPAITFIKASFTTEYQLRVLFYQCGATNPADCRPPGTVLVSGSASTTDVEQWFSPGTEVVLQAMPNPGFVFAGWGPPANSTSFVYRHVMRGPVTFSNVFAGAKRVTLVSDPPDLQLAPDRTPTPSPAEMDWAMGSRHVLGAVSPQAEKENSSRVWVFSHWSNGLKENDVYTVPNDPNAVTITGHFVRGAGVSFVTNPVGLKLRVDGRENWPAYNFVWGVGQKHQVVAPAEQTDARGRKYVFTGWSNGGQASQEVTVLAEHVSTGLRLIANYEAQNRLNISTNPPGMPVTVDGVECRSNCSYDRSAGTQLQIAAPQSVALSDTARMEFAGWSDGGPQNRTFTFTADAQSNLTVSYKNMYRLTALSEPGNATVFNIDPASPDGFYESGADVLITASAKPGFRFRRWEGDLNGSFRSGVLNMSVPRIVRAVVDITPWAEESGVRNAAGETPENLVAPGSIASVFGANLASNYEVGPLQPLAQTIGGVTVKIGNRLLPLLFVSPEQINLQVPSDLSEGEHRLSIRWESYPELQTTMRVVRNAPGLFNRKVNEHLVAIATREDGTEVKPEAPAHAGDVITLYGTGFGPYERPIIDGFPLPNDPQYPLVDSIEVIVGDVPSEVVWAGGAPGQVGTALARIRLPQEITATNGSVAVRVRVNGRESNTVMLPIN